MVTQISKKVLVSLKSHDEAGPVSTKLKMATAVANGMDCHCQVTLTEQAGGNKYFFLLQPSISLWSPIDRTNQAATW